MISPGDIAVILKDEWAAISGAPFLFVAAVVFLGTIVFGASVLMHRSVIATLTERLALKDDQIADLKDKLTNASPEDLKTIVEDLRKQVDALGGRRLRDDQRLKFGGALKALAPSPGFVVISWESGVDEVHPLWQDFRRVFIEHGWAVGGRPWHGDANRPKSGFALRIPPSAAGALSPQQNAIRVGLHLAGIPYEDQALPLSDKDAVAEIVITRRPQET